MYFIEGATYSSKCLRQTLSKLLKTTVSKKFNSSNVCQKLLKLILILTMNIFIKIVFIYHFYIVSMIDCLRIYYNSANN